jgi:hypothetical protein
MGQSVKQVRLVQQDLREPQALQELPELLAWQVQPVLPGPPVLQVPSVQRELQGLQGLQV